VLGRLSRAFPGPGSKPQFFTSKLLILRTGKGLQRAAFFRHTTS
jgi:hypothetical protein